MAATMYRVVAGGIQKDGHAAHRAGEVGEFEEFDAGWLTWAVGAGVIEVVDVKAEKAAAAEAAKAAAEAEPLALEHWHGDPAKAPKGTWEHKWRTEKAAEAAAKGAGKDKE